MSQRESPLRWLRLVWLEVSKVVWPSGGDVVHNSAIVIVMLVAVLLAALAVDATSSWGVFELIAR